MDSETKELKELSEKADAKIQSIQKMKNSTGMQISGENITATQMIGQFTQSSKDQVQRHLADLKDQVENHKEQLPEAEDILSDINRVERDLIKSQPDAVSILSRINDIVKAIIPLATPIPALTHLGNQLLQAAMSVFQR